jgi:hypothetical protein
VWVRSDEAGPPVLSAAGRREAGQRLDDALESLAGLAQRMSAGQRGATEFAEHQRLLRQVEQLSRLLASSDGISRARPRRPSGPATRWPHERIRSAGDLRA